MPSTDWTDLRAAVGAKLNTVTNLSVVLDYETDDIEGFPAAIFEPSGNTGEYFTNTDNFREYSFLVQLIQEVENVGRQKAITIMCEVVDAVLSAFDEDYNLGGACDFVRAVNSGQWLPFKSGNATIIVAPVTITCAKEITVV